MPNSILQQMAVFVGIYGNITDSLNIGQELKVFIHINEPAINNKHAILVVFWIVI